MTDPLLRSNAATLAANRDGATAAPGLLLHSAARYDFFAWLATLGRERRLRQKVLYLGRLTPGESVLDVGCGTGTLAIAAKRLVGSMSAISAIDGSPEMIARADRKARRAGVEIAFKIAAAQALPFPDAQFDVVFSTLMLHHLPRAARGECAREIVRVLKPGGRVLAVDFAGGVAKRRGIFNHFHRHGRVKLDDIIALFTEAGATIVESGWVGFRDLQFALGAIPCRP